MAGKRTRREVKVPNTVLIPLLKTRLMFFGHERFGSQAKVKIHWNAKATRTIIQWL